MWKTMLFIYLVTKVVMWNEIEVCFVLMGDTLYKGLWY